MLTPCKTCAHPDREEIDRLLLAREPVKEIAARFDISASAIYSHLRKHVAEEDRTKAKVQPMVESASPATKRPSVPIPANGVAGGTGSLPSTDASHTENREWLMHQSLGVLAEVRAFIATRSGDMSDRAYLDAVATVGRQLDRLGKLLVGSESYVPGGGSPPSSSTTNVQINNYSAPQSTDIPIATILSDMDDAPVAVKQYLAQKLLGYEQSTAQTTTPIEGDLL